MGEAVDAINGWTVVEACGVSTWSLVVLGQEYWAGPAALSAEF